MKLQTNIPIVPKEPKIDYDSKIVLLGSCFVENIGDKLDYFKFQTLQNPFGILFHPVVIETIIKRSLNNKSFTEDDVFLKDGRWFCYDVHSLINGENKEELLLLLNTKLKELKAYILNSSHIIITLGTSWVYRFLATNKLVANCFKIPQKEFNKELLSVDEISNSVNTIFKLIKENNPKATIITTISPVRHLKDGFVENNLSKSHLNTALHQSISAFKNVFYFPSYEIMLDELRDYRFYKDDMVHPNNLAIAIIWNVFNETWISSNTYEYQKIIGKIQSSLNHKPFNINSNEHKVFIEKLKSKIDIIKKDFPNINF